MRVAEILTDLMERGLDRAPAEQAVWLAHDRGQLRFIRPTSMFEDREVEGAVSGEIVQEVLCQLIRPGVVATTPAFGDVSTSSTLVVFQQIIAAANLELTISSPYLDHGGVELLKNSLTSACKRQVHLRLLTRETSSNEFGRTEGIKRLRTLTGNQLEVRDYHFTIDGRHRASVHTKLLLADNAIGYIGSAEIRRNAIINNFELGVIVQKPDTLDALSAFDTFWKIAEKVSFL